MTRQPYDREAKTGVMWLQAKAHSRHQKLDEDPRTLPYVSRRSCPAVIDFSASRRILHSGLSKCKRTHLCCSEPLSSWYLLQQPWETHTVPGRELRPPGGAGGPQVAVRVTGAESQACGPCYLRAEIMWATPRGWGGESVFLLYLPVLFVFYH